MSTRAATQRPAFGFTLIELMITVVIVSVLAAVAYPSFMGQVRKSRRAEAVSNISKIQQAQERWRANCTTYASNITSAMGASCTGGLGVTPSGSYYTYAVSGAASSSYVVTATAVSGTSQARDTGCTALVSTVTNGTAAQTPSSCWSR